MPSEESPARRRFYRVLLNHVGSRPGNWRIHRVAPFAACGDPADTLRRLADIVRSMPRTEIVTATDTCLHAICRTRAGFRDDLEFRYSPDHGVVHVRSASRVGIYDFGVNRRRVERVRRSLEGTRSTAR